MHIPYKLLAASLTLVATLLAPPIKAQECEPTAPTCCVPIAGDFTLGAETFRSLPDGSWEGNAGVYLSVNLAAPLPLLCRGGIGVQLGGSYGFYDWTGRGSALEGSNKSVQQQEFITVGVFRRTPCLTGFNVAIAYDRMYNQNFGVFALNPTLSQVRYLASYLFCYGNEVGLWGTARMNTAGKSTVGLNPSFRAINQINLFWRHFFRNCAEVTIWGGIPYGNSLMFGNHRPGDYIVGASFQAPLAKCWKIVGRASYMHPRELAGPFTSYNSASNVAIGVSYAFGGPRSVCTKTNCFRPYLPVANNSNFLVDTNTNY